MKKSRPRKPNSRLQQKLKKWLNKSPRLSAHQWRSKLKLRLKLRRLTMTANCKRKKVKRRWKTLKTQSTLRRKGLELMPITTLSWRPSRPNKRNWLSSICKSWLSSRSPRIQNCTLENLFPNSSVITSTGFLIRKSVDKVERRTECITQRRRDRLKLNKSSKSKKTLKQLGKAKDILRLKSSLIYTMLIKTALSRSKTSALCWTYILEKVSQSIS